MELYYKKERILGENDKVELEEEIKKASPPYYSNRDILINSYFLNPVNRNGKAEYSGNTVCGIDGWLSIRSTIKITESGLIFQTTDTTTNPSGAWFRQYVVNDYSDQRITFSAMVDGTLHTLTGVCPKNGGAVLFSSWNDDIMLTMEHPVNGKISVLIWNRKLNAERHYQAAKLELGDQQTLAHQDESGNWVLNEIPNYAEQYAICEQYSLITGKFVGNQHSNPSIIDNGYFIGGGSQQATGRFPINQHGNKEYINTTGAIVYTIDRWALSGGNIKVVLNDEYIRLQKTDIAGNPGFVQILENEDIVGKTVTLSVLYKGNADANLMKVEPLPKTDSWSLHSKSFTLKKESFGSYSNAAMVVIQLVNTNTSDNYIDIKAIKLELGTQQTLAHKEGGEWVLNDPPPNYALELVKCQRYFYRQNMFTYEYIPVAGTTGTGVNTPRVSITLPVPMRLNNVPFRIHGNIYIGTLAGVDTSNKILSGAWETGAIVRGTNCRMALLVEKPFSSDSPILFLRTNETEGYIDFDANL